MQWRVHIDIVAVMTSFEKNYDIFHLLNQPIPAQPRGSPKKSFLCWERMKGAYRMENDAVLWNLDRNRLRRFARKGMESTTEGCCRRKLMPWFAFQALNMGITAVKPEVIHAPSCRGYVP